jgi:hypothetical protein
MTVLFLWVDGIGKGDSSNSIEEGKVNLHRVIAIDTKQKQITKTILWTRRTRIIL